MRAQGFVALTAGAAGGAGAVGGGNGARAGTGSTTALLVTGATLIVTADTAPAGKLTVRVLAADSGGGDGSGAVAPLVAVCTPLSGRNVTDGALGGCDLSAVVGTNVTLERARPHN